MRVVDDVLLGAVDEDTRVAGGGLIGGDAHLPIYVGETGIDLMTPGKKVVTYPVPFATYTSAVGDDGDESMRLNGRRVRRSVPFYLIYVGTTVEQAKWAGERLRLKLQSTRLTVPGFRSWPIKMEVSTRVFADDNVMRPDGSPLFYGTDQYAVSILYTTTGVPL